MHGTGCASCLATVSLHARCIPCAPLQRAADADEPPELNFIRKHALVMKAQGLSNPAARLFSNPAGEHCCLHIRLVRGHWD